MTDDSRLSDRDFRTLKRVLEQETGIVLDVDKRQIIANRLARRARALGFRDVRGYCDMLGDNPDAERGILVDLLTNHETYLFREGDHFEVLRSALLKRRNNRAPCRVWCAAASTGQEVYSIAMTLSDALGGQGWDLLGSDVSSVALNTARRAHYSAKRIGSIPRDYLNRYCLKGRGAQEGTLRIKEELRRRVQFQPINLAAALPAIGEFDAIFLRNVLIYFTRDRQEQIVSRVLEKLRPGGLFFVGSAESMNGLTSSVEPAGRAVFRKRAA